MTARSSVGDRRDAEVLAPADLPVRATALLGAGFRLALVSGHDDGPTLRAVYLFLQAGSDRRVELHVPVDRTAPRLPSLARLSFAAGRFEREMRDLFGIVPQDHPQPARLVRHTQWPQGWYPMLAAAGTGPVGADGVDAFAFRSVEGQGVYEIPVGPVHAGLIEPGHFRFSVVGETVLNLKIRLWFVHRGIEKLFQGRLPVDGLELAERISGDTSVGHALAYCRAVEDALGLTLSPAVQRIRAILLELERLYNHVGDIGSLGNDVGYGILHAQAGRIREKLLRLNDSVTGSRLLRGAIQPGGALVRRLPEPAELTAIGTDVAEVVALALGHSVVRDRFAGTAVLSRQQAMDLGVLGPVARASGVAVDARHDHPVPGLHHARLEPRHTEGDVLSRFMIRAEEVQESIGLITGLTRELEAPTGGGIEGAAGGRLAEASGSGAQRSGVGIAEGWRGTIVHRLELAPDGTIARLKIVDPSFFNWPALPVAMADTIVPDFPLVNKSFNLSYAGNDL